VCVSSRDRLEGLAGEVEDLRVFWRGRAPAEKVGPRRLMAPEAGLAQLQALSLSPVLTTQRDEWLELIKLMNKQIGTVERAWKNGPRMMPRWLCCAPIQESVC